MDDLADRRIESAQQCGDGLDEQRHVVGDDLQCGPDAGAVGRTVDAGDRFTRQAPRREQHVLPDDRVGMPVEDAVGFAGGRVTEIHRPQVRQAGPHVRGQRQ